ncbi:MAG TPA: hypothetical protein VGX78_11865 [Pirellulales bacterium]|jgi:hypothetical protein|nr:hypothetical protein [Pirellulales bacterium]
MKTKLLFSLLAVVGFVMANASSAQAGLFNRGGCCEPSCCAPEPTCCAAEPTCAAAPTCAAEPTCCEQAPCCDTCCNTRCRKHPVRDFFRRLCSRCRHACQPTCCEPACCAPEPTCGCGY